MAWWNRNSEPPPFDPSSNSDDDSDDDSGEIPAAPNLCWSCHQSFPDGQGISIDDTGEQQCCRECWSKISPTARLVLGLLFRRLNQGGLGLADLIEDAMRNWPTGGMGPGSLRN